MINLGEKDSINQLQVLVNFYGKEAMVEFGGKTYTSSPLVNEDKSLLTGGFSREP